MCVCVKATWSASGGSLGVQSLQKSEPLTKNRAETSFINELNLYTITLFDYIAHTFIYKLSQIIYNQTI